MGKFFLSFLKIVLDLHIDSLKKGILGFDYLINRWNKNKFKTFFLTVELLEEKSNLFLFFSLFFFFFLQNSFLIYIDEVSPDIIKTKKSELRLYCDLLMQQVHSVKSVAQAGDPVDIEVCTHVWGLNFCGSQMMWILNNFWNSIFVHNSLKHSLL